MKKIFVIAAAVLLGGGMAGSGLAAGNMQEGTTGEMGAAGGKQVHFQRGEIHPATRLVGKSVRDSRGERLGQIDEIMIDAGRGQVAYLVVTPDPSLGIGEEGRLVPWSALHTEAGTGVLVADVDAGKFKEAPKQAADREQAEQLHRFYGVAPYWQIPASRLERAPSQQDQGEELIPDPTPLWWE